MIQWRHRKAVLKDKNREVINQLSLWLVTVVLVALYALLISQSVRSHLLGNSLNGQVGWQILWSWGLTGVGQLAGVSGFKELDVWIQWAIALLLPHRSSGIHQRLARMGAMLILIGSALVGLIWTSSSLNAFVDQHRPLFVEVVLVLVMMGVFTGMAWRLLWQRWAWLGIIVSLGMEYGIMANVLSRHGWS